MKKSISLWQFAGFVFTSLLGTLLHFLFEWSNGNFIVAPFSTVNESTWEHMKIIFFPMCIFGVIENKPFSNQYEKFWTVKLKGILLGVISIPIIFYSLNGIFGITPDWINITIFFIADAIAYLYETKQFRQNSSHLLAPSTLDAS